MTTLDITHPEIAKQWHPTKNGDLLPDKFVGGSHKKVWWLCQNKCNEGCLHEWESVISNRTKGSNCPYCSKPKKRTCVHESIVYTNPEALKRWHPSKNTIDPEQITSSSDKKAWWLCDKITCEYGCKHEWETQVKVCCKLGLGCPHCSNQKWCEHLTIAYTHKDLAKQLHPTKNKDIKTTDLVAGSNAKIWWICDKTCPQGCIHEWRNSVNNRTGRGDGCPWCIQKIHCKHMSFRYTFPELIKEIHPTKNININLDELLESSPIKIWWQCEKTCPQGCVHEWETSVLCRTNGHKCPYCCNQKICEHMSIKYTHPEIVKQWHPTKNSNIDISTIIAGSHKKYWWLCDKTCDKGCIHEWEASVESRCNGNGCPVCSRKGPRKWCEHQSLLYSHPLIANEWHLTKNGNKKPIDYVSGSNLKIWWQCKYNHEWEVKINSRSTFNTGCPFCVNKTEAKLYDWLFEKYPTLIKQLKLDSCKNKTYLPFDFCIPELKVIIELDGRQHFKQVSNWGTPEEAIKRDVFKMRKATAEGYKIIRIFQEDVYNNNETWLEEKLLSEIIRKDRKHKFISTIEDMYNDHIILYDSNENIILISSDDENEKNTNEY